jgi:hypothetical protein
MVVNVWATAGQTISPSVTVLDCKGRVVATEVLLADGGNYSLRVPAIRANATYYVSVSGQAQPGWSGVGNYDLSIDFQSTAAPAFTLSNTFDPRTPQNFQSLTVGQSQLFHLELTASQRRNAPPTGVQMVIFDAAGHVVFSTVALAGVTSRNDVWLAAGTYTVRFWAFSTLGGSIASTSYTLLGYSASDAIGLSPSDPTLDPTGTGSSGSTTTPPATPPSTSPTYSWSTLDPTLAAGLLGVFDPYSTSWWL